MRLHGGADMRPTLLRVLTDLYVQKLRHTADEQQHYAELALRLLDVVDVATRTAVSARLARHLTPPVRVLQRLVNDLPEIAAPLREHPLLRASAQPVETEQRQADVTPAETPASAPRQQHEPIDVVPHTIDSKVADELNAIFFAADESERRLILLDLDVVAPIHAGRIGIERDPNVGQRLETAALSRNRDEFAQQLAQSLHISREQARRITRDSLGEPIAIAAKALNIPREAVYRILMFINPAVGQSVQRVHALAALYDEITTATAEGMVAIWQSLHQDRRTIGRHQPLAWNDEARVRARPAAGIQRAPAAPQTIRRRDVS